MVTKDIMIRIIGKQINGDKEEEQMELYTEGKFLKKDGSVCLEYDESEFSGMEGCTTRLMIKDNIIRMKRISSGIKLDTEMQFEKGKRFKSYYETPFGPIEMEILTNDIVNKIEEADASGSLNIDYHISLKGLTEGRSILDIQIM